MAVKQKFIIVAANNLTGHTEHTYLRFMQTAYYEGSKYSCMPSCYSPHKNPVRVQLFIHTLAKFKHSKLSRVTNPIVLYLVTFLFRCLIYVSVHT